MDQQAAELKTPEAIQHEMAQTRESLTEKVAALENKVLGTANSVTSAVGDTVEAVKSLVSSAPEKAREAVSAIREQFDVTGAIRRNPWAALGTSTGAGFLLGFLLGGGRKPLSTTVAAAHQPAQPAYSPQPKEPGIFDDLIAQVSGEAKRLIHEAIASTSAALKQNINTGVPQMVDAAVARVKPETVGSGV